MPVHPTDQCLLGVGWEGAVYIDRTLPFGLRSAPKILSALTDTMMWILHNRGVKLALHYLDDFLLVGPPSSHVCHEALATTMALCEELGFPVAPEKTEGPKTTITFLGIEIDSQAGQLRLPQEKLARLLMIIKQWMRQGDHLAPLSSGKKRDLLSFIGLLHHAASVVRPGRAFIRNLIDASTTVDELEHWVHLNASAGADIAWWHTFLQAWNGISVMSPSAATTCITSDASGSWGCGATYANLWFQVEWPAEWSSVSITPKELVPIVIATALWGP